MAESLKEVIAKLKQQQSSQVSNKPVEAVKPAPVLAEMPQDDEDDEDFEDIDELEEKPNNPKNAKLDEIMMEIEMLQNDGRFRAELLHQMQEMNKALIVIAGALVDLGGKK